MGIIRVGVWLLSFMFVASCGLLYGQSQAKTSNIYTLDLVAEGLTSPHFLTAPPNDDRRFVLDQTGQILILQQDGRLREQPFLDLSNRMVKLREVYDERGLLGLAFHPNFKENGRFFVYYSAPLRDQAPDDWDHTSHLSEFQVSNNPEVADPNSERIILKVDQPQLNHNGGRLLFGPDDYLYIGLGDGGAAGDVGIGHPPLGNGQDVTTLLGSILRIDIDQKPYGIPDTNPLFDENLPEDANYAGEQPRGEIWTWGMRNPWGMAFDAETGDFFVADVGQDLWEEVNRLKAPGNYGWNLEEGTHGFNPQDMDEVIPDGPQQGPLGIPLNAPEIEYRHPTGVDKGIGNSVIGGYVYRGKQMPELQGRYVFADWSSQRGEAAGVVMISGPEPKIGTDDLWPITVAIQHDQYILGLGEDAAGELYILASNNKGPRGDTGRVYKMMRKD